MCCTTLGYFLGNCVHQLFLENHAADMCIWLYACNMLVGYVIYTYIYIYYIICFFFVNWYQQDSSNHSFGMVHQCSLAPWLETNPVTRKLRDRAIGYSGFFGVSESRGSDRWRFLRYQQRIDYGTCFFFITIA